MTIDKLIHDMLVYFMPTVVLVVVLALGWAVTETTKMKQRGWRKEDEPPWDDDKE